MQLSEIDSGLRRSKSRIDRMFNQYLIKADYALGLEILSEIGKILPSEYENLNQTLEQYRKVIHDDTLAALRTS